MAEAVGGPTRGRPPSDDPEARNRLLQAARELLSERSTAELRVRDVAERAGCNAALITYYFGGRDGLIEVVVEEAVAELGEGLLHMGSGTGSVEERMKQLVHDPIVAVSASPHLPRILIEEILLGGPVPATEQIRSLTMPYLTAVQNLLAEGSASGELRTVDPDLLVLALGGIPVWFVLMRRVWQEILGVSLDDAGQVERFSSAVADIVMYGIATREPAAPEQH